MTTDCPYRTYGMRPWQHPGPTSGATYLAGPEFVRRREGGQEGKDRGKAPAFSPCQALDQQKSLIEQGIQPPHPLAGRR
jgi:hypothetical protein